MGNLNFQDEQDESQQKNQPDPEPQKSVRDQDAYIDDPTSNSRVLWIAIIVVLIAGIGGALYMLNRAGYLKFQTKHKPAVTTMTAPAPSAPSRMAEAKPAQPAKSPAGQQGSFALQVSAFRTQSQADMYISALKKKGIDAWVLTGEGAAGHKWYRVCTGNFDTKLRAIAAVENMKKEVGTDVWVVPAQ